MPRAIISRLPEIDVIYAKIKILVDSVNFRLIITVKEIVNGDDNDESMAVIEMCLADVFCSV